MFDWPSIDPPEIVAKAREFIGTPWHHCGRVKGAGIDCIGLLVCTLTELGVPVIDDRAYPQDADCFAQMVGAIERYADPVVGDWLPGDALVFRTLSGPVGRRMYNHCGLYNGSGGMIHAWASPSINACVEHPLSSFWESALVGAYRYRGVEA